MPTQSEPSSNEAGNLAKAHVVYQKLLAEQQSAILATVNADGSPWASYAPFVADADQTFYVFVSTLSRHTANLARTGQASLMVIADELQSPQVFARQRLTFSCQVTTIARNSEAWQTAAALYEARFGDFFKLIGGFNDFQMFGLTPQQGWLVVGFGQAYEISGSALDVLTHQRQP
ncbi:MAG: pyridoxamine 5'-phosphate oxidase family protein [Chloroflexales bacterium]|nr:pyridoxamine 5'-phosphate oxidase family protein [Chloroflexales bacterium]